VAAALWPFCTANESRTYNLSKVGWPARLKRFCVAGLDLGLAEFVALFEKGELVYKGLPV
jgi:hypothetical protein